MKWGALIFIVVIGLYFASKLKPSNKKRPKLPKRPIKKVQIEKTIEEEAVTIVEKITSEKQLELLEKQRDNAQSKIFKAKNDRSEASAERRYDILDRAVAIAYEKPLAFQYSPVLNLHTPLLKIESAGKVFSTKNIEEAKNRLGNDEIEWTELFYGEEPEVKPPVLNELKKFRAIIESDKSEDQKAAGVNQLVTKSKYLIEEYFPEEDTWSPWDHWKIESLRKLGVPAPGKLYQAGYKTFNDCLKADPEEIIKIDGIGPKTQQALIKLQAKCSA
jgi:hypothetical protein